MKYFSRPQKKLSEAYRKKDKRLAFALVVHCTESNFRCTPLKEDPNKQEYPWLHYFKSQDGRYPDLKVGFREIPMHV